MRNRDRAGAVAFSHIAQVVPNLAIYPLKPFGNVRRIPHISVCRVVLRYTADNQRTVSILTVVVGVVIEINQRIVIWIAIIPLDRIAEVRGVVDPIRLCDRDK